MRGFHEARDEDLQNGDDTSIKGFQICNIERVLVNTKTSNNRKHEYLSIFNLLTQCQQDLIWEGSKFLVYQ